MLIVVVQKFRNFIVKNFHCKTIFTKMLLKNFIVKKCYTQLCVKGCGSEMGVVDSSLRLHKNQP